MLHKDLDKEFVPHTEAYELKSIGFDEPCLAVHYAHTLYPYSKTRGIKNSDKISQDWTCTAPLYQQAFRFFREKYNLIHEISWSKYKGGLNFDYDIFSLVLPTDDELGDEDDIASDKSMETYHSLVDKDFRWHEFNTPEEAELACLRELIKIVKSKQ